MERENAFSFKPLQNGAVLCCATPVPRLSLGFVVSNPFRTGRYCAEGCNGGYIANQPGVSNPFRTGRYCADGNMKQLMRQIRLVSNPFRTGRYCAAFEDEPFDGKYTRVSNPFRTGRYCADASGCGRD